MPRANGYSEVTALNIRLAVRQAVTDFCASPERTVEGVVKSQFENSTEPIQRLIAARLENIYEQLQYSILSPSNEPPSSESVLKFLSEFDDESEKDIIQRFEKGNTKEARRREFEEWRTVGIPPLTPIHPAPVPVNIPRLEDLTSGSSSNDRRSGKRRKSAKNGRKSNSFRCTESTSSTSTSSVNQVWSKSASDSAADRIPKHRESERPEKGRVGSGRKVSAHSSNHRTQRSANYKKSDERAAIGSEEIQTIRKAAEDALPVVLQKDFIPTAPSVEERATNTTPVNIKSRMPVSSASSLRSDDDRVTVRYVPAKVATVDAAVSTEPMVVVAESQIVEKVEVGVNTTIEMGSNLAEGSSSSNTASDNSAGQLPKRLYDAVLQRPSLRIVSLRPDGSIVPTNTSTPRRLPSVREWTPAPDDENAEKLIPPPNAEIGEVTNEADPSYPDENEEGTLDSVSASASRPDPSEEDLNTMANISPLPHS